MWWLHAMGPSDKRFYCSLHHVLTEVNIIPTPPRRRSARPSHRMRPRSTTSSASRRRWAASRRSSPPLPVQAERPCRWTMKHGELNETYPDIEGLEHKRRHEELKWDTSQIEWKQINLTVRTLIFSSCSMNKNKCISPLLSSCRLEKIFRNKMHNTTNTKAIFH